MTFKHLKLNIKKNSTITNKWCLETYVFLLKPKTTLRKEQNAAFCILFIFFFEATKTDKRQLTWLDVDANIFLHSADKVIGNCNLSLFASPNMFKHTSRILCCPVCLCDVWQILPAKDVLHFQLSCVSTIFFFCLQGEWCVGMH